MKNKRGENMENFQKVMIDNFVDGLETELGKELSKKIIDDLPDYWYQVPASSSGKYHPFYTIGENGLFLHSMATLQFITYMLELEQYKSEFTPTERDAIKIGAFCHDGNKHGEESKGHTIFSHPLVMAQSIRKYKDLNIVPDEMIELIASVIETHMGEWNTNKKEKNVVLPKPVTLAQKLVHLADYLASRKNLEVHFDYATNAPTIDTYVFNFGMHKGKTFKEVLETAPDYLQYLKRENYSKEPLKTFLKEI